MGNKFTTRKQIVSQGHSLSINLTSDCKYYGIRKGDLVEISIKKIEKPTACEICGTKSECYRMTKNDVGWACRKCWEAIEKKDLDKYQFKEV